MQIVINIDEGIAQSIIDGENDAPRNIVRGFQATIADAIKKGTPLPKGHGRLIDTSKYAQSLIRYIDENKNSDDIYLAGCGDGAYHAMCMLKDISTIIEADKEDNNDGKGAN